jgi:hypothetical protein
MVSQKVITITFYSVGQPAAHACVSIVSYSCCDSGSDLSDVVSMSYCC